MAAPSKNVKTERVLLFQCPACNGDVEGELTLAFDLGGTELPDAAALNAGRAQVQVAVKATGMTVSHTCQGVDSAAGRELQNEG